jgi:hypothetical protein
MARSKNVIETSRLTFSPSAEAVLYLDELVQLGIYGKGRAEVVEGMVMREIERLIKDKILVLRHSSRTQQAS